MWNAASRCGKLVSEAVSPGRIILQISLLARDKFFYLTAGLVVHSVELWFELEPPRLTPLVHLLVRSQDSDTRRDLIVTPLILLAS